MNVVYVNSTSYLTFCISLLSQSIVRIVELFIHLNRKNCKSCNETYKVINERRNRMNIYGVLVIIGVLAFLGLMATGILIFIIIKMRRKKIYK